MAWEPIPRSDSVLPPLPPDDIRSAFIAKTEKEWAAFREADIIVARDSKMGALFVVFGRERVDRARADGDEKVPALIVEFNPDTDELECLAAACVVMKGRHELQSRGSA